MLEQVDTINYRIIKELGIVGQTNYETTELNIITWNNHKPKLDLRKWKLQEDGTKRVNRGLTLTDEEARNLNKYLTTYISYLDAKQEETTTNTNNTN